MKILVANNNPLFIRELRQQVSLVGKKTSVIDVKNYSSALSAIYDEGPFNLMLLDLGLAGMDWKGGMNKLTEALDGAPIVVLSTPSRFENISQILDGMLSKVNGNNYLDVVDKKTGRINMLRKRKIMKDNSLTPRQTEVLEHLGEGLSNKQIAYEMSVSEATVKLHINALLRNLHVTNRTQAVLKGQEIGLL